MCWVKATWAYIMPPKMKTEGDRLTARRYKVKFIDLRVERGPTICSIKGKKKAGRSINCMFLE